MGKRGVAYSLHIRIDAAKARDVATADLPAGAADRQIMNKACQWLREKHPAEEIQNPARLIRSCVERFAATGTVSDRSGRGRKRKMSSADINRAAGIIGEGYRTHDGRQLPWRSVRHAVQQNNELRSIKNAAGVKCVRTVKRSVQADHPHIQSRRMRTRPQLSDEQVQARRECASDLLAETQQTPDILKRMVFLDSKAYTVGAPENGWYIVNTQKQDRRIESQQPLSGKLEKINAYVAAGFFGPYGCYPGTGSTWLPRRKKYKVSCLVFVLKCCSNASTLAEHDTS